jgi:hypothetical protein
MLVNITLELQFKDITSKYASIHVTKLKYTPKHITKCNAKIQVHSFMKNFLPLLIPCHHIQTPTKQLPNSSTSLRLEHAIQ